MEKIKNFIIEILTCRNKIKRLEKEARDPRQVIEKILERGIDWYDYDKLEGQDKLNYYLDIQRALSNQPLANEIKHFLGDLIQEVALSEADHNRDKLLRFSVNGVKALLERLESLEDPRGEKPPQDDLDGLI